MSVDVEAARRQVRERYIAMRGGGQYNRNSDMQAVAVDRTADKLLDFELDERNISVADYGCSEGINR